MPSKTYSKVIYGGQTLIDLTGDTVEASKLASGYTAHDRSGAQITGTSAFDSDTSGDNALASEILSGKTAHAKGVQLTGTMPNRGAVTGTISSKSTPYTIQQGYHDGSGTVSIDATEAAKLISENIRQGVTILGVEGSMSGSEDVMAESRTVTPTTSQQTIIPDSSEGYNYLSQVVVNAIPYSEAVNEAGGYTATIG